MRRDLRCGRRVVPVGRCGARASTPQAIIYTLMVAEAQCGEPAARIKGGGPFAFGRGGEESDALREAGQDLVGEAWALTT